MSDNKPPMTVWLDWNADRVRTLGFYSPKKECLHVEGHVTTFGPYVNIGQFLEEVERRASECAEEGLSFDSEFVDIARELAKEIKGRVVNDEKM